MSDEVEDTEMLDRLDSMLWEVLEYSSAQRRVIGMMSFSKALFSENFV